MQQLQTSLEIVQRDVGLDSVIMKEIKQELDYTQPDKLPYRKINLPNLLQPMIGDVISLFNQYFQDDILAYRQQFPVIDTVLEKLELIKQLQYLNFALTKLVLFLMLCNF